MKKRAQIAGQMFVYVLGFIIFALVLLYGYNAIKNLGDKAEQTSFIQFKTEITQTVKTLSTDYGTVRRKDFALSGRYIRVCFVDSERIGNGITLANYPLIEDSVTSGVDVNLFLVSGKGIEDSFNAGKLDINRDDLITDNHFTCVPVINGKLKVKFTGLGNRVRVESDV
jgi:hypothetical protein